MRFQTYFLKESEDFSTDILDTFLLYQKKVEYAKKHLKKLGEGSSRIVFENSPKTVIKISKNKKGYYQNISDSYPAMFTSYSKLVPKTLSKDGSDDYSWIIVERAEKFSRDFFKKHTGISFESFSEALKEISAFNKGKTNELSEDVQKLILENKFLEHVKEFMEEFDLTSGDLVKTSSWGILRNHPVIFDAGLTRTLFEAYYKKKNK